MKVKALSLFSNVGIAETYLKDIGINVVVANELCPKRAKLYSHFYPKHKMIVGDINTVYNDLIINAKEKECNMIIATPPCQGFSVAGKRDKNDVRNNLIIPVLDAINDIEPEYVLIENVQQFLSHQLKYQKIKGQTIDVIKTLFGSRYNIIYDTLNSKDYGVPQTRKRAFILMSKNIKPKFPDKENIITIRDAISHLPSVNPIIRENLENEKYTGIKYHDRPIHCARHVECMENTPTGKSAFENEYFFPKKKDGTRVKGYNTTYKRMNWDDVAPTITTANGVLSSQCNVHPGRKLHDGTYSDPRVLTLLEIMILFSLPKDWNLPENYSENFIREVIGEGIPPLWFMKIAKGLING